MRNKGVCKDLQFVVQGVNFQQHLFLMELGGTNMVLGIDWFASLGNIEANFRNFSLKWTQAGQQLIIRSDPTLNTVQSSWSVVMKALQGEGLGYYVECMEEVIGEDSKDSYTAVWEGLLAEFQVVLEMPIGLLNLQGSMIMLWC